VQCVPPEVGSFEQRKPLPEEWAGKRDADLQRVTSVSSAIFCHPGRFIAGAKYRDDALDLARQAVAHS